MISPHHLIDHSPAVRSSNPFLKDHLQRFTYAMPYRCRFTPPKSIPISPHYIETCRLSLREARRQVAIMLGAGPVPVPKSRCIVRSVVRRVEDPLNKKNACATGTNKSAISRLHWSHHVRNSNSLVFHRLVRLLRGGLCSVELSCASINALSSYYASSQ